MRLDASVSSATVRSVRLSSRLSREAIEGEVICGDVEDEDDDDDDDDNEGVVGDGDVSEAADDGGGCCVAEMQLSVEASKATNRSLSAADHDAAHEAANCSSCASSTTGCFVALSIANTKALATRSTISPALLLLCRASSCASARIMRAVLVCTSRYVRSAVQAAEFKRLAAPERPSAPGKWA